MSECGFGRIHGGYIDACFGHVSFLVRDASIRCAWRRSAEGLFEVQVVFSIRIVLVLSRHASVTRVWDRTSICTAGISVYSGAGLFFVLVRSQEKKWAVSWRDLRVTGSCLLFVKLLGENYLELVYAFITGNPFFTIYLKLV